MADVRGRAGREVGRDADSDARLENVSTVSPREEGLVIMIWVSIRSISSEETPSQDSSKGSEYSLLATREETWTPVPEEPSSSVKELLLEFDREEFVVIVTVAGRG